MHEQGSTHPTVPLSPIEDLRLPFSERLEQAMTNDQRSIVHTNKPVWCDLFNERLYPSPERRRIVGQVASLETVRLGIFQISRYQVSVWQFRQFMHAGGYTCADWWSMPGWAWIQSQGIDQPSEWRIQHFDNHPVTGISLHEVEAYCRWLTRKAQQEQWIGSNAHIRLPSSIEWEIAARWNRRTARLDDWRAQSDNHKHDIFDNHYAHILPMGLFPDDASPCGALDMAGNVWEWCTSLQSNEYVLCGGCWSTPIERVGWSASITAPAERRGNTAGFRVLLSFSDASDG